MNTIQLLRNKIAQKLRDLPPNITLATLFGLCFLFGTIAVYAAKMQMERLFYSSIFMFACSAYSILYFGATMIGGLK